MAELGAVATILQIADVGLRLSTTLFTFAETIASADKAVSSISKDISLTSSVLRELADILKQDKGPQIYSNSAVDSAVGIVKECSGVFQEVKNTLIEKLPKLSSRRKDKTSRTTAALERLKWPYLQPKINLLRSNLDRLKSSLLVILNVISLAKLMKTAPSSVDAGQTALVKDLIQSNKDYVRKYEELKQSIMPTPTKTPFMQLNTSPIQGSQLQEVYAEHSLEHETKLDNLHHFISLFDRLQQEVTTPLYAIGSKSRSRIKQHISDARSSETMHLHRIHGEAVMRNIWTKMGSLATSFDDTIRTNVTSQTQDSDSRDRTDLNLPYAANLRDVHTPTLYESGRVSPVGLDTFQPAMRSIGLIFADRGPSPQDSSPDSVKDHPIVELNTMYKASTPAQLMSHRHSSSSDQFVVTNTNALDSSNPPQPPPQASGHSSRNSISVVESRSKPRCWDHGCNGLEFPTFGQFLKHQRYRSTLPAKSLRGRAKAEFTRTTARDEAGVIVHQNPGSPRGRRTATNLEATDPVAESVQQDWLDKGYEGFDGELQTNQSQAWAIKFDDFSISEKLENNKVSLRNTDEDKHKKRKRSQRKREKLREGITLLKSTGNQSIPRNATWTKIDKDLVCPQALDMGNERYEDRTDDVIVLRVLAKDEIEQYVLHTRLIRQQESEKLVILDEQTLTMDREATKSNDKEHRNENIARSMAVMGATERESQVQFQKSQKPEPIKQGWEMTTDDFWQDTSLGTWADELASSDGSSPVSRARSEPVVKYSHDLSYDGDSVARIRTGDKKLDEMLELWTPVA